MKAVYLTHPRALFLNLFFRFSNMSDSYAIPDTRLNNREFFRLAYPLELMPTIVIGHHEYAVPEISEHGFRVRCHEFDQFRLGQSVDGKIYFTDGTTLNISSTVYRRDHREFVLQPAENIPFKRILVEQRRVITRFPPSVDPS